MTREELLVRVEKKEKDITKIQKRIDKWSKGLRTSDIEICMPFTTCIYGSKEYIGFTNTYKEWVAAHRHDIPTSDDWNKGPNIDELKRACIDMGEAKNTLSKYKVEIEKIDNFEKSEKIKPIWDFLCNWEEKCYGWYLNNAKRYFELKSAFDEEFSAEEGKWLASNPKPDKDIDYPAYRVWEREYRYMKDRFTERYYSGIDNFTKNITHIKCRYEYPDPNDRWNYKYVPDTYTVDEDLLKKTLAKEKVNKYNDLVNRVTSVVGNIVDASDLSIGNQHGEINGIVVGDRSKARVETISAGGYNTSTIVNVKHGQCFHYRVIIHEVK